MDSYKKRVTGARSKANGEHFELACDHLFRRLREAGAAHIQKTPEPMRVISRTTKPGTFYAVFTKMAQPDYQGTLDGGRSVVLEAKFTDSDRITQDRISELQAAELTEHARRGALCAVLVCFSYDAYGLIPWSDFTQLKAILGRKYVKADDLEPHGWKLNHYLCNAGVLAQSLGDTLKHMAERG